MAEPPDRLGLNLPLLTLHGNFLTGVMHGDLATSLVDDYPVVDDIGLRLLRTLELIAASGSAIGVDIGGTSVKLGAVAADGRILATDALAFAAFRDFTAFAEALAAAVLALGQRSGAGVLSIGVASPGFVDPDTGIIDSGADNVPILRGKSVVQALRERGLPVSVALNDGVAAAIGEHAFGTGSGLARFVLITLGTGVGGCVMLDGSPLTGRGNSPPELGAMVLDMQGPKGSNGLAGTLETYACAEGFRHAYADLGGPRNATPEQICAAAGAGDARAAAALDTVCGRIAQGLGTLINALNLEACLIGGGISQAGPTLLDGVAAHLPRFTWPPLLARVSLRLAATGSAAGWLGAAVAAKKAARKTNPSEQP